MEGCVVFHQKTYDYAHFFLSAMGKEITSETKEAWDSNAITPGTPFMHLLANSLRYWVVQKLNTDPGWENVRLGFIF